MEERFGSGSVEFSKDSAEIETSPKPWVSAETESVDSFVVSYTNDNHTLHFSRIFKFTTLWNIYDKNYLNCLTRIPGPTMTI